MSYAYENNRLKTLTHNGTKYKFGYGKGCLSSIGYETINSLYSKRIEFVTLNRTTTDDVKTVQYSADTNSYKERYTYDKNGRLLKKDEGATTFANVIENAYLEAEDNGLKPSVLNYTIDKKAKLKYTYTYDDNRKHVTRVTVANTDNNATKYVKNIGYDGYDRVTTESYGDISYMYTREDGNDSPDEKIRTASTLSLPYQHESIYSYDALNRITQKQTVRRYWSMYPINGTSQHVFYQTYDYHAGKSGTNETTGRVKSEKFYPQSSATPTEQYEYSYDANGNVTEIEDKISGKKTTYSYDGLNRLVFERNEAIGNEYTYTYDNGGNITCKRQFNSTGILTGTTNYGYSDSYWKDQLTSWGSYGTSSFAYDSAGNPTKYKGKTLTWQGKKLIKYANSTLSYMDLSYDGNGMLVGYTQNDTYSDWAGAQFTNVYSREITRDGDRILSEKVTSIDGSLLTNDVKTVKYTYDAGGISGMIVGTTEYFFRRNIFGDVTAIYDTSGVKKAEYSYDAWGTCYMPVNVDGIGSLNPFRYRGYYFVSQIGLYYLTTRFYDYTTGRFLNADEPSVGIEYGFNVPEGCNLYTYCLNNPISYVDPTGHVAISLIVGTIVAFGIGMGMSAVTQGLQYGWDNINIWQALFDGAMAAGSVLLAATGIPLWGSMLAGGVSGFGQYAVSCVLHGEEMTWSGALIATGLGVVSGLISKAGARNMKVIANKLDGRADQGVRALITTAQRYGVNSKQMVAVNRLYRKAIDTAIGAIVTKSFTKSVIGIWCTTASSGLISLGLNKVLDYFK